MRVAVLRGGPSSEYDVSLKTGEHVLGLLRMQPEKYDPQDIFISRDGVWHSRGVATTPDKILHHTDVVFNALHGAYGEDGQVQKILMHHGVPFTGSESLASALSMDKGLTKDMYLRHGLMTPRHVVIRRGYDDAVLIEILRTFMHPVVVKPAHAGSSVGLSLAHGLLDLKLAIKKALNHSKKVIVEEFVRGKEATCGVVENARGHKLYALIPVEIKKPSSHVFDYDAKYSGQTLELCPGTFSTLENKKIEEAARIAHQALGLQHYSRSDFIVTPKGNIYILETNSLPGFTTESLLPKSLKAVGWEPRDFISHLINLALEK